MAGPTAETNQTPQNVSSVKKQKLKPEQKQQMLWETLNHMPALVFCKLKDKTYRFVNLKWEKVFSLPRAQIMGQTDQDLFDPSQAESNQQKDSQVWKTGEAYSTEDQWTHPDGETHVYQTLRFPLVDSQGEMYAIGGVSVDLTEKIKMQQEKEEIQGQLQQSQKLEAIGQLAGGIAHDFNNILGGVLGFAELIKSNTQEQYTQEKIEIIIDASKRAADLTKQLLGFARKGKYQKAKLELNHVVKAVVNLLKGTLDKGICLRTEFSESLWPVEGDAGQLQQVLLNLGINARDAMPEGGHLVFETHNVELSDNFCRSRKNLKPGSYVRVSISDSGQGMPEDVKKNIFNPFFTTKEVGKGTGLGLSMVYGIMGSHGGAIDVQSDPGVGTVFNLYLPAQSGEATVVEMEPLVSEDIKIPQLLGKRILVVDDEFVLRKVLEDVIFPTQAEVVSVGDGEQALSLLLDGTQHFDLVILDLVMPEMTGYQVYYHMKQMPKLPQVLFSSGFSESDELATIREQDQVDFLQKPFQQHLVYAKLAELLEDDK